MKESGYAGFELDIDIYFKCQRDEPKKVTFRYDLSLPSLAEGPVTISQRRTHIFTAPSAEFRRKLLDGGCTVVNPSDDRSRETADDRSQHQLIGKPKLTTNSSSISGSSDKKHKTKLSTEEPKASNTFDNLFGTPIMKMPNLKQSPEQLKISSSSNAKPSSSAPKSTMKNASSILPSSSLQAEKFVKDKSYKLIKEKKDRSKISSPLKKSSSKESLTKKSDSDRPDRREEKRREKSNKDRDKNKEKCLKKPPSPKASRSPKRSVSPSFRNSSSNRPPEPPAKADAKNGGSVAKKTKKDKRSDREYDRSSGDSKKDKDAKNLLSSGTSSSSAKQKDAKTAAKAADRVNGASKRDKGGESGSNTPKESKLNNKYKSYDVKVDSPHEPIRKNTIPPPSEAKKTLEKDEKNDSDRKHKHKKKDKNKEKERFRSGSKDRKKEKEKVSKGVAKESSEDASQKRLAQMPTIPPEHAITSGAKNKTSTETSKYNCLSEDSSVDCDSDQINREATSPADSRRLNAVKGEVVDTPSTEIHDIMLSHPARNVNSNDSPSAKGSRKSNKNSGTTPDDAVKVEKKRKRKNKIDKKSAVEVDVNSTKRRTASPVTDEPPSKYLRKDELIAQCSGQPSQTPPLHFNTSHINSHMQPNSITSNSSISLTTMSNDSSTFRLQSVHPTSDYISQLRSLQHRIMSLQDNSELQQVVDMIAATGCYEITSRTFDFDLCALDRNTVQRLQDFLSQSAVS